MTLAPPTPTEAQEPTTRGELPGLGPVRRAFARWDLEAPRGRVVLAHGYGEHGGRYAHVARWLNGQGWSVSAMDFQGFGRSGGPRGDARGIRPFVEDLAFFLRQERLHDAARAGARPVMAGGVPVPPAPVCPQVLLGHSLGGLVGALTLLWHADTLDALVLTSPCLKPRELPRGLQLAQTFLSRVAPHWILDLPGDKREVCSDPAFVAAYEGDPLCHNRKSAALWEAILEGRRELLPLGAELDRPILLMEAGEDAVVDPDGSEVLWQAVRPELLRRHRLEGFKHEIFHDLRRGEAEILMGAWLEELFPAGPGTKLPHAAILNEELKETP